MKCAPHFAAPSARLKIVLSSGMEVKLSRIVRSLLLLAILAASVPARAADFPEPYNSEKTPGEPMPAEEAAAKWKVPPGFKVQVFASEPDVRNPIACAWDPRGRLWIAENYTYSERELKFDPRLRDRVLIFEDADGDGHHDKRTDRKSVV